MEHLATAFHHCAISVRDLNRTVAFYTDLGFVEVIRWTAPDGSLEISHLANGHSFLEVFCYSQNAAAPPDVRDGGPELESVGVKHFALLVGDLVSAHELLKRAHHDTTEISAGRTGIEYFFARDPDGIWFEIVRDERDFGPQS
jgi:glyoxylase I family protein